MGILQAWYCEACGRYYRYRADADAHAAFCDGHPPLYPQRAPIE